MANDLSQYSKDELLAMLPNNIAPAEPSAWALSVVGIIVLSLIVLSLLAALFMAYRHFKRKAYRKQFATAIEQCQSVSAINAQLKLLCFAVYGRDKTASLSGENWLHCLDAHHDGTDWMSFAELLERSLYGGTETDPEAIKRCAIAFALEHKTRWSL